MPPILVGARHYGGHRRVPGAGDESLFPLNGESGAAASRLPGGADKEIRAESNAVGLAVLTGVCAA